MDKIQTQWFTVFMFTLTATWFAYMHGVLATLFGSDVHMVCKIITGLILVLLFRGSLHVGQLAKQVDTEEDHGAIEKRLGVSIFLSELCFDLGLAGTVAGLVIMFKGMTGTDPNTLIEAIKNGLGTAFFTTGVGILANIILRIQIFIVQYGIKDQNKNDV